MVRFWMALACALALTACQPVDPSSNGGGGDDNNDANNTNNSAADMGGAGDEDMGSSLPEGVDVTVATFNVQRLFDSTCNSGQCDAGDFEDAPSELQLESRFERIQRGIDALDADVIVLQEIETEELLEDALGTFAAEYQTIVFGETGGRASLDVAVISRGELLEVVEHRDAEQLELDGGGTERFARELLEVHLDLDGERVIVFGAHFISKRTDSDGDWREAEGARAAELAVEAASEHPDALVVLGGDLNDTPESRTLRVMDAAGMAVPTASLDAEQFYTYIYAGARQILDHVLFIDAEHVVLHPDGVEVFRDEGRSGFAGSDHAAMRGRFRLAR